MCAPNATLKSSLPTEPCADQFAACTSVECCDAKMTCADITASGREDPFLQDNCTGGATVKSSLPATACTDQTNGCSSAECCGEPGGNPSSSCNASGLITNATDIGECNATLNSGKSCTQKMNGGTCTPSKCTAAGNLTKGTCTSTCEYITCNIFESLKKNPKSDTDCCENDLAMIGGTASVILLFLGVIIYASVEK